MCNDMLQGLDKSGKLCHTKSMNKTQTFFVAQRQPTTDEVEILWECTSEEQADNEVDRINSSLSLAGIPGIYHAFVM